jgi:hypothetical protein
MDMKYKQSEIKIEKKHALYNLNNLNIIVRLVAKASGRAYAMP